jgi:hypothetical protein
MAEDTVRRIIITSAGASALLNLHKVGKNGKLPIGLEVGKLAEDTFKSLTLEKAVELLLNVMVTYYGNKDYNSRENKLWSAEVSSLTPIAVNPQDTLYFIGGTRMDGVIDEGQVCGEALAKYYTMQHIPAEFIPVEGFTHDSDDKLRKPLDFLEALNNLVASLRKAEPTTPILINLTSGYKLASIYAALVGLMYGCELYYLHESMGEMFGLPPITADVLAGLGERSEYIKQDEYTSLPATVQRLYVKDGQKYHLLSLVDVVTSLPQPNWRRLDQPDRQRHEYLRKERLELQEILQDYEKRQRRESDPHELLRLVSEIERTKVQIVGVDKELDALALKLGLPNR